MAAMDLRHSPQSQALLAQLQRFMADLVLPSLADWQRWADAGAYPLDVIEPLKAQAQALGLWNLCLTTLPAGAPGTPLSHLDYARQWLWPLLRGEIRSCFAMSEPDVASADPTGLQTRVQRDGDHWVLNGRKWFITGAQHPQCRLAVVVARSEGDEAPPHARHALLLVPMDSAGLVVERNIPVMDHAAIEGHCEIVLRNVRVPLDQMLGAPGQGFALAQARLGPGRLHHAMRSIGQCELALALMCERARERRSFGARLADRANVQESIADSRVEIDQARLLVLRADRAMQVFGAMGLSPDTPLARLWAWGRALRVLDGPDEVHLRSIARAELKRSQQAQPGMYAPYLQRWLPAR